MLKAKLRNVTDEDERERRTKDLIDAQYSGRVLIIDEVHNIRTGSDKEVRDTIHYIEMVIKYSTDLKLGLADSESHVQSIRRNCLDPEYVAPE